MLVRLQQDDDCDAVRRIYAAAFARPEGGDSVPLEVGIFDALCKAGDALPELSFMRWKKTLSSVT